MTDSNRQPSSYEEAELTNCSNPPRSLSLVPPAGLEPARTRQQILSLQRLPFRQGGFLDVDRIHQIMYSVN
jgi:hypothetical protein